jgi:arsenate reductase
MLFICYTRCTTCKKAQKWLDEQEIIYQVRDIKTDNPTYDELKMWQQQSGLSLKRFFNTSGQLYRNMKLKDKLSAMSDLEQLQLLVTDGMLLKRPILVGDDFVLVGFKEEEWKKTVLK